MGRLVVFEDRVDAEFISACLRRLLAPPTATALPQALALVSSLVEGVVGAEVAFLVSLSEAQSMQLAVVPQGRLSTFYNMQLDEEQLQHLLADLVSGREPQLRAEDPSPSSSSPLLPHPSTPSLAPPPPSSRPAQSPSLLASLAAPSPAQAPYGTGAARMPPSGSRGRSAGGAAAPQIPLSLTELAALSGVSPSALSQEAFRFPGWDPEPGSDMPALAATSAGFPRGQQPLVQTSVTAQLHSKSDPEAEQEQRQQQPMLAKQTKQVDPGTMQHIDETQQQQVQQSQEQQPTQQQQTQQLDQTPTLNQVFDNGNLVTDPADL
ncbi:hypothetical protein QJQ45_028351, partial [Haematococcus lacustris]